MGQSSQPKRLIIGLVQLTLVWLSQTASTPALSDPPSDTTLKPDVPQLAVPVPKPPLKGGVQHRDILDPPVAKPLNGSASDGGKTLKGKASGGKTNAGLLKRKAQSDKIKQDLLNAETQLGIGIIGVKFVMAFGKPPVINRVFPGTPAFDQGLRPDDIIVAVDGVPTFGLTKDEVYGMIVGIPNTPVQLSIRRNSDFIVCRMNRMDFNDLKDPQVRRDYQNM
jgi:hypothetical protein